MHGRVCRASERGGYSRNVDTISILVWSLIDVKGGFAGRVEPFAISWPIKYHRELPLALRSLASFELESLIAPTIGIERDRQP
jgi:hypothetical protein